MCLISWLAEFHLSLARNVSSLGSRSIEGLVEITINNITGTICDHGWDEKDATVVCAMLGYGFVITAFIYQYLRYWEIYKLLYNNICSYVSPYFITLIKKVLKTGNINKYKIEPNKDCL